MTHQRAPQNPSDRNPLYRKAFDSNYTFGTGTLFLNLPFRQCIAHLQRELTPVSASPLLEQTLTFYQLQLHRSSEGARYLEQRGLHDPATIEELGIGFARGGNLRRHLATLGYSLEWLLDIGLIDNQGRDVFCRRVIFPWRHHGQIVNLYGRSIGAAFRTACCHVPKAAWLHGTP